jgi:hypothetical protein
LRKGNCRCPEYGRKVGGGEGTASVAGKKTVGSAVHSGVVVGSTVAIDGDGTQAARIKIITAKAMEDFIRSPSQLNGTGRFSVPPRALPLISISLPTLL